MKFRFRKHMLCDYFEIFLYHTTGDDGGGSGLAMNYNLGYSSFSGALLG